MLADVTLPGWKSASLVKPSVMVSLGSKSGWKVLALRVVVAVIRIGPV